MQNKINQLVTKAFQNFNEGRLNDVEVTLAEVLKIHAKNFDALLIMGVVKGIKSQHLEALDYFKRALKIDSQNSPLNFNIAKAFSEIDQDDRALKYHLKALELNASYPEGWLNYGRSLSKLNKLKESIEAYEEAIKLNPSYAEAWTNKGNVETQLSLFAEALVSFEKAIDINPQIPETWLNRGNALQGLAQYQDSLDSFDRAIFLQPDYAKAWFNRGNSLQEIGLLEESILSYEKTIALGFSLEDAWYNRGIALQKLKEYDRSIASFDEAIKLNPNRSEAWCNKGVSLLLTCQFLLAESSLRESIRVNPLNLVARSALVFCLNYLSPLNPQLVFVEAKLYGEKLAEQVTSKLSLSDGLFSQKKLSIGFVSADLSSHSVGFFVEGLFKHLDATKFDLYAFSASSNADDLTERIKPFFKEWIIIDRTTDKDAAGIISQRNIHVLIDLSGHTANSRLPIFAYRPAPLQVTWLGLPVTTGIAEIDYVIGDPYALPSEYQSQFIESLWRLPDSYICMDMSYLNFKEKQEFAQTKTEFVFGSFNNLSKINDDVVEAWSKILHALPSSKLYLKCKQLGNADVRSATKQRFEIHGINSTRLILSGELADRITHLQEYHKVDIALDTFPYPGVTTSLEALWMGVPVVSLKGSSFLSSTGTSISINAGLHEWIASDVEEYVNKAVAFALDAATLTETRSKLIKSIEYSPLFQIKRFADNFGGALIKMWEKKCVRTVSDEVTRKNVGIFHSF